MEIAIIGAVIVAIVVFIIMSAKQNMKNDPNKAKK